ncbi:GNAT family N-acetyltransferase [Bradyrhizobium sp. AUGA SZCCT0169]|uniref:GNAT family N-acetyltransferase n=1 Tax=Bradyrhizobium sp. AUGA SZCCT0169 TaxID=2807663 RepID=UPI001BA79BD2|nr:GNAT family N-acetyltransferase [Bradyrhizobium sp. AUGA SZCCT0169]MBR1250351.1 GNAT family N-acetyltransferase [Bradyrhizobium sp. AUGA SZCCT0169]
MTTLTNDAARHVGRNRTSQVAAFSVEFDNWDTVAGNWDGAYRRGQTTIFQHEKWLAAWYGAFAGQPDIEPLVATVRDRATGEVALLLPLIRRKLKRVCVVEFADLELTDYNAPLLGPAAPREPKAAAILWRELRLALRRLPGGADLIRFKKMPLDLQGGSNPLAMLDGAGPCSLNGNLVTTGEDFDQYKRSLKRDVRKVLERCWRAFTAYPGATFKIAGENDEALRVLAALDAQQSARMQHLGINFILGDGACADFYRNLVRDGVGEGYAVLSALTVGEEVVATLLGVRCGSRYVMLRVSNAGDKWSSCSPGRLVIERTMAALHSDGVREFDFSVGDYDYKRRFGVTPLPLVDISAALSLRGLPYALRDRAARELRNYPKLSAYLKRAPGKPLPREEN